MTRTGFVSLTFAWIRWAAIAAAAAPALFAHVMSMSTGELTLDGARADLELRMPLYEIAHIERPEAALLDSFSMSGGGGEAERVQGACETDESAGVYVCRSRYEFPSPPDQMEIVCLLAAATVPNHVHLLRAVRGDVVEQTVFDFTFTRATIRFVPPTPLEAVLAEMGAGLIRVVLGPAQILFVLALALAARGRRELWTMAAAFVAAQSVSAAVVAAESWQPAPRFVEAAAALTIAYLAVEILALPEARGRWAVTAGMGVFHGFYFGTFITQSEMAAVSVLVGAVLAEAALLALFALGLARLNRALPRLRPVKAGAATLLAVGMGWFLARTLYG